MVCLGRVSDITSDKDFRENDILCLPEIHISPNENTFPIEFPCQFNRNQNKSHRIALCSQVSINIATHQMFDGISEAAFQKQNRCCKILKNKLIIEGKT